ncbi:MAG: carbon-nitrogen hydrolase family protein [bacterium]|nr:carbon-nitrogen hydrolase family protein [bacterium]
MKVALYQGAGLPTQVDENLEIIQRKANSAAGQGADLIIIPELFLTGYNIGQQVRELAEPADGPACQKVARIAREADIAILYGYPERLNDDVYNSALLINRAGNTCANYRKTHLYGSYEKKCFKPGDSLIITKLEGLNIGILICYDVEFPEAVRSLVNAGADLIAVPTALMEDYCRVANQVVPVRAYENGVFVAYVNRCGIEGDTVYCGRSCLAGPDGRDILRAGQSEELLIANVDKQTIAEARETNPVLSDVRRELYKAPVKNTGFS